MNDQTIPDVTDDDRKLAREWAESIDSATNVGTSRPRTNIDGSHLQHPNDSATNSVESTTNPWSDRALAAARVILHAIPAPPRPTLADMTPEDRHACRWMQVDVKGRSVRPVIVNPYWEDGTARVMWPGGSMEDIAWERITPRPDLPRLEWPGDQKSAPALPEGWRLADHEDNGRVIVTTAPDRYRRVYYVLHVPEGGMGFDWLSCDDSELTYIDQETGIPDAVPPNTLAAGSEWEDVDALARACKESGRDQIVVADKDGDVFVWGVDAEWWETGLPGCDYAPYTITHTGRKANQ